MTSIRERCPSCGERRVLLPIEDRRLCLPCLHDHKTKGRTPS